MLWVSIDRIHLLSRTRLSWWWAKHHCRHSIDRCRNDSLLTLLVICGQVLWYWNPRQDTGWRRASSKQPHPDRSMGWLLPSDSHWNNPWIWQNMSLGRNPGIDKNHLPWRPMETQKRPLLWTKTGFLAIYFSFETNTTANQQIHTKSGPNLPHWQSHDTQFPFKTQVLRPLSHHPLAENRPKHALRCYYAPFLRTVRQNRQSHTHFHSSRSCPPEKPRPPCHYSTYVNLPHATNCIILAGWMP